MTPTYSRRQILIGVATVAVVGAGAAVVRATGEPDDSEPSAVVPATPPVAALVSVGEQYLSDHPEEADVAVLREHLGVDEGAEPPLLGDRRDDVQDDLVAGRTVDVAGWVMAETEARIAALAALA